MPRLIPALAAILLFAPPVASQEPTWPTADDLAPLLTEYDVPGLSMAVIEGCAPAGTVTTGIADLETDAPVTPDTAFEAASLTKPVFAVIVMHLVEAGVVDLDRPLAETFAYPRIPDDRYAAITPRMVLTHRTGLPNWVDDATPFHERTAPIPFEADPGTAFTYSGEAFQLLQAFVEDATGEPFEALFERHLGRVMPRSALARPLPGGVAASRGYARASDPASGRGLDGLGDRAMAASSLVTTATDYARFLSHVCDGAGLRPETLAEMLRPQSDAATDQAQAPGAPPAPPTAWGLGWMIADMGDGATFAGHGGNNGEYRAFAGLLMPAGDGIVVLTNGAAGEAMIHEALLPMLVPAE